MSVTEPLVGATAETAPLTARVSRLSDTGLRREHNEDRCLVQMLGRPAEEGVFDAPVVLAGAALLLAVCDGMGGAAAGEVASAISVETLSRRAALRSTADGGDPGEIERWLVEGVREANRMTLERVVADPALEGMGSTLTAAVLSGASMVLAHVGDSRAYHLRDGSLRRVTADHSLVGRLVALGRITEEQAREHEQRHLLLEAIGTDSEPEIDRGTVPLLPGDRVLLCSDGLTDLVRDEEIGRVMEGRSAPAEQCAALVAMANGRGGVDNVTVVIAHLS